MKHVTPYSVFEASAAAPAALTPEQVEWLNECTEDTWKLNPQTGLVDVDGRFDCSEQGLSDFKGVRFGVVGENFYCSDNRLTSLVGAPRKVGRDFYCWGNRLTSLEGAPREVGGSFNCDNNLLTSLEGAPREVGGVFSCDDNQLTSLEGAPRKVGSFSCDNNPVSEETLERILYSMNKGESYLKVVESLWAEIPLEDQVLLYRPEFKWVGAKEAKKLQAVGRFNKIKGML